MKNIILSLVYFLISFVNLTTYAYTRQEMFETANKILQLARNQGDYASYTEMMETFEDFRSKIKADLELGNIVAAVDYELLVEGLALENYPALQSVVGFNNFQDTTKEFQDLIESERTYKQKIAYAIQENKIAFQTTFEIKLPEEQNKCELMLNGKKLENNSFIGPAGVPFYIGLYCPDNMFEVKKIQAAEAQKFYSVTFENLKKIIYRDDPVEMGLPNPNITQPTREQMSSDIKNKKLNLVNQSKEPSLFGSPEWKVETGIGLDVYLRYNAQNYYIYSGANQPILLYSSTQFLYKHLELQIDIGPVSKENRNNATTSVVVEKERTLFLRPIIAYNQLIYRHKQQFALNGDIGIVTFFAGTKNAYLKPMTLGAYAGLEPKFYLWSPMYIGLKLAVSFNVIGSAQNTLASGMLRLGADL